MSSVHTFSIVGTELRSLANWSATFSALSYRRDGQGDRAVWLGRRLLDRDRTLDLCWQQVGGACQLRDRIGQ